jgi:RimJ/RimL family protein N-acetyltransferase
MHPMRIEAPILETERLRLRPLRSSDLNDYAALYADPEVVRYFGDGGKPWDRGRSWRHLAFLIGHWRLAGTGSWAVEHKESGAFLGVIGFSEPAGWPGLELAGRWPAAGGDSATPPRGRGPPWTMPSSTGSGTG